jgi:Phage integrase, N-terminal SAM-like domain
LIDRGAGDNSSQEPLTALAQRLAVAGSSKTPVRSRVAFRTLATDWQSNVLPMYKQSTQKNHRHLAAKHLLPRFGDKAIVDVTRQEIQGYVAQLNQAGYAPKTIDHIDDVLSALLRTAVKWAISTKIPPAGSI